MAPKYSKGADSFLELYKDQGAGLAATQFVDRSHWARGTYYTWRSKYPGFRKEIDKLQKELLSKRPGPAKTDGEWSHLESWQGEFLDRYRKSLDRVESLAEVNKNMIDLEDSLQDDPAFAKGFLQVEKEIVTRSEDVLKQRALHDRAHNAAQKILEAKDPAYMKRVRHEHTGGLLVGALDRGAARQTWRDMFGPLNEPEVIEGEVEGEIAGQKQLAASGESRSIQADH